MNEEDLVGVIWKKIKNNCERVNIDKTGSVESDYEVFKKSEISGEPF